MSQFPPVSDHSCPAAVLAVVLGVLDPVVPQLARPHPRPLLPAQLQLRVRQLRLLVPVVVGGLLLAAAPGQ